MLAGIETDDPIPGFMCPSIDDGAEPVNTVQGSHTLQDMSQDFAFFTIGPVLFGSSRIPDMAREFARLHPDADEVELPIAIDYCEAFFHGMGVVPGFDGRAVNLDHRLYAIVHSRWLDFVGTLCSAVFVDRDAEYYATIKHYMLDVVDYFALAKQPVVQKLPTVPVGVFALESTEGSYYLRHATYPSKPRILRGPPVALSTLRVNHPAS